MFKVLRAKVVNWFTTVKESFDGFFTKEVPVPHPQTDDVIAVLSEKGWHGFLSEQKNVETLLDLLQGKRLMLQHMKDSELVMTEDFMYSPSVHVPNVHYSDSKPQKTLMDINSILGHLRGYDYKSKERDVYGPKTNFNLSYDLPLTYMESVESETCYQNMIEHIEALSIFIEKKLMGTRAAGLFHKDIYVYALSFAQFVEAVEMNVFFGDD